MAMIRDDFDYQYGFRKVPRTGVIYVMNRATESGFRYGKEGWANLGQGAPEAGPLDDDDDRLTSISVDTLVSEYAPVAGSLELRQKVADLYNARYRQGKTSKYSYRNVAISPGGRSGLTRIAAALGNINLGHFLPDYTAYEELFEIFKAFVPIPIVLRQAEGFCLQPERLQEEVISRGLGAVLMSNPCNPTGQVLAGRALSDVLQVGRQTRCTLIFDEFYSHYVYHDDGHPAPSSAASSIQDVNEDAIVIVDGLTKNWRYPGLRLSWTLAPEPIIEKIASAASFLDGGASHPIQKAAIPLLDLKTADAQVKSIQRLFLKKRQLMYDRLTAMGFVIPGLPQGGFYCFASLENLPESLRDGMDFFEALLEQQVICVPGEFFDVNPGKRRSHIPSRLKSFVRFSYGPPEPELELGLAKMERLLATFRAK